MERKDVQKKEPKRQFTIDEQEESLILEQIKYLHSESCSIQSSFLSLISISLGVYGIILYNALSYKAEQPDTANILFIILPFLFSLSYYNIIKYTIKMLGIDAYIRHLEVTLNETHSKAVFRWQSFLVYANNYSYAGIVPQIPCHLAIIIFIGYEFFDNIKKADFSPALKDTFYILLVLQVCAFIYMLIVCAGQYSSIEYWCRELDKNVDDRNPRNYKTERLFPCVIVKQKYEFSKRNQGEDKQ